MMMRSGGRPLELGCDIPIIQAPMAGSDSAELAAAVSGAGGLGSIGAATHSLESLRRTTDAIRRLTNRSFNLNFFCHTDAPPDPDRDAAWLKKLAPYFAELGVAAPKILTSGRAPFDEAACALTEELKPAVVSFHFGLPPKHLLDRVKAAGCAILASATTPSEAAWLESQGVAAVIAQGAEAGGHRGVFAEDWREGPGRIGSGLIGTMALVPLILEAIDLPVIAAGGIADGRGIAAALALGASAVQIGTAYLLPPEAGIAPVRVEALKAARAEDIVLTNVISGRPARGIANRFVREAGPMAEDAPHFPLAASAQAVLRKAAEEKGSADFSTPWAGQAAPLWREMPAGELTQLLWRETKEVIAGLKAR
jgi:nitronate monooxygenase